jgi:hypothetical protein
LLNDLASSCLPQRCNAGCTGLFDGWFNQMFIGFKIGHPLLNFEKQLAFYRKKCSRPNRPCAGISEAKGVLF